jgi:glycosyltransferase involved in cell wall biosynthesis
MPFPKNIKTQPSQYAICTIFARNYLAHARTLAESFLKQHPDGIVFALLCDKLEGFFDPGQEPFVTLDIADLGVPHLGDLAMRYNVTELSTAVKPFLLDYLLKKTNLNRICYFDPDILFLNTIDEIFAQLDVHNIVLLPHLTGALNESSKPNEHDILITGAYNLGFIGIRRSEEVSKFLQWWGEKLLKYCYIDFANNLFVDQRWIDLVPGMFDGVYINRDPGYDVAYWNLMHRTICQADTGYTCLGQPVRFFHFSGFNPRYPDVISKHQDRFTMPQIGDAAKLFELYRQQLLEHGYEAVINWPYAFNHFTNGTPIPEVVRSLWKQTPGANTQWVDPFDNEPSNSFYEWLVAPVDGGIPVMNRVAEHIYHTRPDVQRTFPRYRDIHRRDFVRWFVETGIVEHKVDPAFADMMQESLARSASPLEKRVLGIRSMLSQMQRRFLGGQSIQTNLNKMVQRLAYPFGTVGANKHRPVSKGLNVIGYLSAETGVGEVPRALARSLTAADYPIAMTRLANPDGARSNDLSALNLPTGTPYDVNLFCVNADSMSNVKEQLGRRLWGQKYNIAFWFWEIANFPEIWRNRFDDLQEVWVGSSFVQEAISAMSPIPVVKIGIPITLRPPASLRRQELGLPQEKFIFLYAFDMLSIPERKNPLDYISAFKRAFEPHFTDVHLVLKVNNLHYFKDWETRLRTEVQAVQGTLIDATLDRAHVDALFQHSDAYVSLHRSEGFGLTIAEAMRLEIPVIATDYSGNRDFLNEANGFPVRYELIELERDYGPYCKGNVWAQPNVDHAADLMRYVLNNREEAKRRAQLAAQDIDMLFGPQAISKKIIRRLEHLEG